MAYKLANAAQQASADAVTALLNTGGAGNLKIYSGSQPADADTAPSGTLLATIALAADAFGDANSSGVSTMASAPRSGTGAAAGTAGCFTAESGAGTKVWSGTVTATGGGGDLTLDNISIAVGQAVSITSLTYAQPAG